MTKNISKALDMVPLDVIDKPKVEVINQIETLDEDLDQARRDIKEIAEIGIQAVAEAASLASQSQHDKLYMALSSVMKSTIEANKELIGVHRSRKELKEEDQIEANKVTNNLFVGSTAELLQMLKKEK